MKTILPFGINYTPMEKLALINFEKKPDTIYKALELQYMNSKKTGVGYKFLAYRNDRYVDLYDDLSLHFNPDEKVAAAEKGLHQHVQTEIKQPIFEQINGYLHLSFSFKDIQKREIYVHIKEHSGKKSRPVHLLAPIGIGSENPVNLPVFFLYNFDFVRRRNTEVNIRIDGLAMKIDPFPVPIPIHGERRYFTRYTMESQILDF